VHGRASVVGHVQHRNAGLHLQQFGSQVQGAAGPGRAVVEFARVRLGVGHEVAQCLARRGRPHHQDHRRERDASHRGELLVRVVGQLGIQQGIEHCRGACRQEDRVAIGRGRGHHLGPERRIAARLVVDDDRLAEIAAHAFGQGAPQHVGNASHRVGHDKPQRLVREFRGTRGAHQQKTQQAGADQTEGWASASRVFGGHVVSLWLAGRPEFNLITDKIKIRTYPTLSANLSMAIRILCLR
jgi:hypothetical protein